MKILWITNIIFPEANLLLTGRGEHKSSGGWMLASAKALLQIEGVELIVACVNNKVKDLTILQGKNIKYYVLPYGKGNVQYNTEYEKYWITVNKLENPDVVHIHGTEFSHGAAYVNACNNKNVVVSIQGLVGEIGNHYCDGLSKWDIYKKLTLRDIFKGTCFSEKKAWIKRGQYERKLIETVNFVIGRTTWDRAKVWAINPNAKYYHCDETLRDEFYTGTWKYENCTPHSIFVSQAYYPIKGLHQVLKAMPLILKCYPDTVLKIAGANVTQYPMKSFTSYFRYLKAMIKKYHLSDHVQFCGPLTSEEMKDEYLKANIFICPSSIENSSNALSEAQILGVPCLASYVGGLPTLMKGKEACLYRFDDFEHLSFLVCSYFQSDIENIIFPNNIAKSRHDPQKNINTLLNIYKHVADECQ